MGNCARRPLHVSQRQVLPTHVNRGEIASMDNVNALRGDGDLARDNRPVTTIPPTDEVRPNMTTGNEDLPTVRNCIHVHVAPLLPPKTDSMCNNRPQSLVASLPLSVGNAAALDGNFSDPTGPVIQFLPIASDGTSYDSAGGAAPHITFPSTPSRVSSRRHRRASSVAALRGVNETLLPLTSQHSNSVISQRQFHSPESSANTNVSEAQQVAFTATDVAVQPWGQQLFERSASRSARQQRAEDEVRQQTFLPVAQQRSESTISGMRGSRSSAAVTTTATSSHSDEASQAFEKSDVSIPK